MGQRVLGQILELGQQGSWRAGGVARLCGLPAYAGGARVERTAQRLFCAHRLPARHLYLFGRELSAAWSPLIRLKTSLSRRAEYFLVSAQFNPAADPYAPNIRDTAGISLAHQKGQGSWI